MKLRLNLCCLFFALLSTPTSAQSNPTFSAFAGPLYHPISDKKLRYGFDSISLTPIVGIVSFKQLDFLPRHTDEGLPGVEPKDKFGVLLSSTMTVDTVGQYTIVLASDDGSRLWIEDSLVINNDKPHKWTVARDTISLYPGEYPVKVWYFNAYINMLGVVLDVKYLGPIPPETLTLPSSTLFDYDSYRLQKEALAELDAFAVKLAERAPDKVTIIGHTDNQGDPGYNEKLSLRRAKTVKAYLVEKLGNPHIEVLAEGRGMQEPVADNSTEEGQAQNRRVEIRVE